MQKTSQHLPDWLVAKASVERALFGHITRRTAGLINTRSRRPARTRSERPQHPITQNVGRLIEARLSAAGIRLPARRGRMAQIIPFPTPHRAAA